MNLLKRDMLKGIFFVLAAGSLAHFIYEWSGYSTAAGLFFPVNESTWEHMKMLFFPMLLFCAFESVLLRKRYPDLFFAGAAGILIGLLLIPTIFYTYSGILGKTCAAADMVLFYVSILCGFLVRHRLAGQKRRPGISRWILGAALLALAAAFFAFTWNPPGLGIFENPLA